MNYRLFTLEVRKTMDPKDAKAIEEGKAMIRAAAKPFIAAGYTVTCYSHDFFEGHQEITMEDKA